MSILSISDFSTGRFEIPTNPKQDAGLQLSIDYVEGYYLPRLLGVELNTLFLADFSGGVPVSPRFIVIFDPFTIQDDDECIFSSDGIKEMLKGLVYYHYGRDQQTRLTTVGAKATNSENSENKSSIEHDLLSRFNQALESYHSIQFYCDDYISEDYPEYKGVHERYNHPF
jgi:hypothetical protein